jgi:histidinol-phosphate aminotransferase
MKFDLEKITRKNIWNLVPYSSARSEYRGTNGIFLDANENSLGAPISANENGLYTKINRYPDPMQIDLKDKISKIKGLPIENIFLGNGSDEAIDILFRTFCEPGKDEVIVCPPTYGMYEVAANINDVKVVKVPLVAETFRLDEAGILNAINQNTKLIFFCCPNNPTGNGVSGSTIKNVLDRFNGIVVVDEAYINFASYKSMIPELQTYPNLVVLQTLSKAWGLAGLRIGMAFASEPVIDLFNKVKPPYNINILSQRVALDALSNLSVVNQWIKEIVSERNRLSEELSKLKSVLKVYPSEANFLLVKFSNASALFYELTMNEIIIRDRSKVTLCEGCLRITIGTKSENDQLLTVIKKFKS